MIVVRDLRRGDVEALAAQPAQSMETALNPVGSEALIAAGPAFAVEDGDGRLIACAGFHVNHERYASVWALLATGKRHALVPLTRACRRAIAAASWRRIDTTVRDGWPEAAEWAAMCGLQLEARLAGYFPDGSAALIFARSC